MGCAGGEVGDDGTSKPSTIAPDRQNSGKIIIKVSRRSGKGDLRQSGIATVSMMVVAMVVVMVVVTAAASAVVVG